MEITLDDIKRHLQIELDCNEDDLFIADLESSAADVVRINLNLNSLDEIRECNGLLPAGVYQAMLLLIGTWYANRESISYGSPKPVPHGLEYILDHYRRY